VVLHPSAQAQRVRSEKQEISNIVLIRCPLDCQPGRCSEHDPDLEIDVELEVLRDDEREAHEWPVEEKVERSVKCMENSSGESRPDPSELQWPREPAFPLQQVVSETEEFIVARLLEAVRTVYHPHDSRAEHAEADQLFKVVFTSGLDV
jgi:hypothetical protein